MDPPSKAPLEPLGLPPRSRNMIQDRLASRQAVLAEAPPPEVGRAQERPVEPHDGLKARVETLAARAEICWGPAASAQLLFSSDHWPIIAPLCKVASNEAWEEAVVRLLDAPRMPKAILKYLAKIVAEVLERREFAPSQSEIDEHIPILRISPPQWVRSLEAEANRRRERIRSQLADRFRRGTA